MSHKTFTVAALAAGVLLCPGLIAESHATLTETVLYTTCPSNVCNGRPSSPVLKVGSAIYGVGGGGAHGGGVVWRYGLNTGTYRVLYDFCTSTVSGVCQDGSGPTGKLIADVSGNLYGVTSFGGTTATNSNAGTIFELVKPTSGTTWTHTTIYDFCPFKSGGMCADGNDPQAGLSYASLATGTAYDPSSGELLYGTTLAGGTGGLQGQGTVYALRPNGGAFQYKVIHKFLNFDGLFPMGQYVVDASSSVITGTTLSGGSVAHGVAYQLSPTGDLWADPWTNAVIYNFCWPNGSTCHDGQAPNGLVEDSNGAFWGTADGGNGVGTGGNGVVFKLDNPGGCTEGGIPTFWCNTVKHQFCLVSGCSDGSIPSGDIAIDSSNVIYGTTRFGGSSAVVSGGAGVVYSLSNTTQTILFNFCTSTCTTGYDPLPGISLDAASGDLYGVTGSGGDATSSAGVVYKLN